MLDDHEGAMTISMTIFLLLSLAIFVWIWHCNRAIVVSCEAVSEEAQQIVLSWYSLGQASKQFPTGSGFWLP